MDRYKLEELYRKIEEAMLTDDRDAKQNNMADALEMVKNEYRKKAVTRVNVFEIEDVIKMEMNGHRLALVKLIVSNFEDPIYDGFLLTESEEWRLSSFFRSIGEKKQGKVYRMDWDHLKGKHGLCKINKFGRIERYFDKIDWKDVDKYSLNLELIND